MCKILKNCTKTNAILIKNCIVYCAKKMKNDTVPKSVSERRG